MPLRQVAKVLKKPSGPEKLAVSKKPAKEAHLADLPDLAVPKAEDPLLNEIRLTDSQGYTFQEVLSCLKYEYDDERAYTESFKTKGSSGQPLDFFQNHRFERKSI